jgi:REP-associated tyrosine transposase
MPRSPRVFVAGLSHHVYQRGHNRARIFDDPADYERFLWLARESACEHGVDIHGYGLMTNHYHLVVTPRRGTSLANAMHDLNGAYSKYYNHRYDRSGTLWAGRYRAPLIEDERRWLTCLRYVEANPVKAKIVSRPEDYRWTSYHVHAWGVWSEWLVPHPLYLQLGATPAQRQATYRALWGRSECQAPGTSYAVPGSVL